MWPHLSNDDVPYAREYIAQLEEAVNIARERVESARLDLSEATQELDAARERLAIAQRFEEGAPV